MKKFLPALASVLSAWAISGCVVPGVRPDYAPLHTYNDAWDGTVHFANGTDWPVRLEIYSTRVDQQAASSPAWTNLEMTIYAELLDTTSGSSFIGMGTASHYDRSDLAARSFSPVAGHEFVDLILGQTPEDPAAPDETTSRMKEYAANWQSALKSEGQDASASPMLGLTGEYSAGAIRGIAYLTSDGGVTKSQVGTFELSSSRQAPNGQAVSDSEVDTDQFAFITKRNADQTYSFTEEYKP